MSNVGQFWAVVRQLMLWSGWLITARAVLRELAHQCIAAWSMVVRKQVINVVIIKSSRYDIQDGFVIRHFKAILPSNTMTTIYSLVNDVRHNLRLGIRTRIITRVYDETVQDVNPARIARLCRTFPGKTLVMIVGVQTNEFARASDIAVDFQDRGVQVIVGGFHVSGVLKKFPMDGSELSERAHREMGLSRLSERGVSLFAGESEGRILELLRDFIAGRLQRVYNYLCNPPDLTNEPVPEPVWPLRYHFAFPNSSTIDACRGCPWNCSFCTIKNVQGRKIRSRGVPVFVDRIRSNWRRSVRDYFFTSDNSARDPLWQQRFDEQIDMRRDEGIKSGFMVQVDTKCHRTPKGFITKAAEAGCNAAFIGLETLNPNNLPDIDKEHNNPAEYPILNDALREHGIAVQYGYMIGLPQDTPESIRRDVDALIELCPDLVTFFVATLLPGADDHYNAFASGVAMDSDLNSYDSFSGPVAEHPLMAREELMEAYNYAWQKFYSVENMVRILRNNARQYYWRRFWSLTWYKYALDVIERHPMVTGFVRQRSRSSRRDTFPKMGRIAFQLYNLRENIRMWRKTIELCRTMVEVWLRSRERTEVEEHISGLVERRGGKWVSLRVADLRRIYQSLGIKPPRVFRLISQLITARTTRQDIEEHWSVLKYKLSRGRFWELFRPHSIRLVTTDVCLAIIFVKELFFGSRANTGGF